jgi:hypothetical protein
MRRAICGVFTERCFGNWRASPAGRVVFFRDSLFDGAGIVCVHGDVTRIPDAFSGDPKAAELPARL